MKDIMNFGIEEARRTMNENKGGPFGAVITDSEGNIISVASNRVLELHDATAHAEVMAIREAGKILGTHDLSNCILNKRRLIADIAVTPNPIFQSIKYITNSITTDVATYALSCNNWLIVLIIPLSAAFIVVNIFPDFIFSNDVIDKLSTFEYIFFCIVADISSPVLITIFLY